MKKVADEAAVRAGKPGSFAFEDVTEAGETYRRMWVHLPSGFVGALNLEPAPASVPMQWPWNGSLTKPTVARPIQLRGRWCGHIRAGRMISEPAVVEPPPPIPKPSAPPHNPIRQAIARATSPGRALKSSK